MEKKDLKIVIDFELAKIKERLAERGYDLRLTSDAKDFLIKKGTNLDYGARPLRRALENFVEDPLSEELLQGHFEGKNKIVVDGVRNDAGKIKSLKFESDYVAPPEPPPEPEEAVGVGAGEDENGGDSDE